MNLHWRALRILPSALIDPLVRSRIRINEGEIRDVQVAIAQTVEEIEASARLLHDAFVSRRLIKPQPSGMRFTPHLAMPSTITFVASEKGKPVGTLSLVMDSALKLPIDNLFAAEVSALRAEGRKVAEVGSLCVAPGYRRRGVSFLLNKTMWLTAEKLGVQDLVITVRCEAELVYRAWLLFRRLGKPRPNPLLGNTPHLAMRLDLCGVRERYAKKFAHLPRDERNPDYMFFAREHAQIVMPTNPDFVEKCRQVRGVATAKIVEGGTTDFWGDLSTRRADFLQSQLPDVALPVRKQKG